MALNRRQFVKQAAATVSLGIPMITTSDTLFGSTKQTSSGQIHIASLGDEKQFAGMRESFSRDHPGICLSVTAVDGETSLRSEHGGMKVFWIYRGQGEIFLPRGYRTKEGDGQPLPKEYRPDPLPESFGETLRVLKSGLPGVVLPADVPLKAIVGRWKEKGFMGDFAGDLWKLEQIKRPWAKDPRVEKAIAGLFQVYREQGFSTKRTDSWERLLEGDQLIACGQKGVQVRGRFQCLAMEKMDRKTSHVSAVRRLRYLVDTAGGCNPDFDPFRRLPLTWHPNYPGESGDGLNWVNSHVVNIPKETSPSHFHPRKPLSGGLPQAEMYLVLDPKAYKLNTFGRKASINLFPDLRDLGRCEQHALKPGLFVYIPPGTGHRGLDVFVNVLTIPGFKPNNEFYLDQDIRDRGKGKAPFNENLLNSKNYTQLEDLL